jgi:hypothetical protein
MILYVSALAFGEITSSWKKKINYPNGRDFYSWHLSRKEKKEKRNLEININKIRGGAIFRLIQEGRWKVKESTGLGRFVSLFLRSENESGSIKGKKKREMKTRGETKNQIGICNALQLRIRAYLFPFFPFLSLKYIKIWTGCEESCCRGSGIQQLHR